MVRPKDVKKILDPEFSSREKFDSQLPYGWIIMQQINRVAESMTSQSVEFMSAVEALELLISPFLITYSEYEESLREIEDEFDKKISNINIDRDNGEQQVIEATYTKAKLKMKLLMKYVYQLGFLPEKTKPYIEK